MSRREGGQRPWRGGAVRSWRHVAGPDPRLERPSPHADLWWAGTIAAGVVAIGCILVSGYLGFGWAGVVLLAVIGMGCALAGRPWLVGLSRSGAHAGIFFFTLALAVLSVFFLMDVLAHA